METRLTRLFVIRPKTERTVFQCGSRENRKPERGREWEDRLPWAVVQPITNQSDECHKMSETPSDPAATGRRRSSVVYDPARDVFQPAPDTLPTVTEERVQASANGRVFLFCFYADSLY